MRFTFFAGLFLISIPLYSQKEFSRFLDRNRVQYASNRSFNIFFIWSDELTLTDKNLEYPIYFMPTSEVHFSGYNCNFSSKLIFSKQVEFKAENCSYSNNIEFNNGGIKQFSNHNIYNSLQYSSCIIDTLEMGNDTCRNISFLNCDFKNKTLQFAESMKISGNLLIKDCNLDTINLVNSNIKGDIIIYPLGNGRKVNLLIDDKFQVQSLKCSPSSYNLVLPGASPAKTEYLFRQIIDVQKTYGSTKDAEEADIELKNYLVEQGDIFLGFQKFLWNYGYDKALLLKRLLYSFLIFYFFNLFVFKTLIEQVYTITNLHVEFNNLKQFHNRKLRYVRYPVIVFLYSCIVFFGWKMDIDRFPFRHLLLSIYLLFFYLMGLGLLFYVIGFLFNK